MKVFPQVKKRAVQRAAAGEKVDVRRRKQTVSQQSQRIPVLRIGHKLGVFSPRDARIGITQRHHRHVELFFRQPGNDFLHCEVLRIGVVFVGGRRRKDSDGTG